MPLRLFTCPPGREPVLVDELARVFPKSSHKTTTPGWVQSHLPPPEAARREVSIAFARQCLPDPVPVGAASVSLWARTLAPLLIDGLREHTGPWRLHVFCVDYPGGPVGMVRARLIEETLLKALREQQRRLWKARVIDAALPWSEGEALVQVGLETASRGWLSICPPGGLEALKRSVSRFPGGLLEVPEDPQAPSKAHRKLLEAQLRLGRPIAAGETCVDLGGSPGGWSFVALEQGARVTAVDRSPLREDLMAHPRLTFVQGDAFRFLPAAPVDWLLCDVIAFPERSITLLDGWLERGLCRRFCVTVKFRGDEDYPEIERLKGMLRRRAIDFEVRQLLSNRNEVTAFGVGRGLAPEAGP